MGGNVLLILVPVFTGICLGQLLLLLIRRWSQRVQGKSFWTLTLFVIASFAYIGAWIGLIISIQINRVFFNYEILTKALGPNGIVVLYGFGPGLTPQFLAYWHKTNALLLLSISLLLLMNFYYIKRCSSAKLRV